MVIHHHILVPDVPFVEGDVDALLAALHAAQVSKEASVVVEDAVDGDSLSEEPG